MLANPDGSGRTLLLGDANLGPDALYDLDVVVSPTGGHLAVYAFEDPETLSGPTLSVIRVPVGGAIWETPLLSARVRAQIREAQDPDSSVAQAAVAVVQPGALAWSPDGLQLAFTAALDGPSSDLYVFDLERERVRRVSSGPNQIGGLAWSPDGQMIVHQAVVSFGSGSDWEIAGVWSVAAAGQPITKLYEPPAGREIYVGWSEGNSLISYSLDSGGPHDIRASGAESGIDNVLVPSHFLAAAYDSQSGVVAYAAGGAEPGAYLWHPVWSATRRAASGDWTSVVWAPRAELFYFVGPGGILAVTPEAEVVGEYGHAAQMAPSPNGRYVAVWGGEDAVGLALHTSDLERVKVLTADEVSVVRWRADSAGLMAAGPRGLLYLPLDGPPMVVDPEATIDATGDMGWVFR
ncbi:MAG TPA: hypothetical protein VFI11_15775 [Anaerolineales bacterium]|nr:hypothetical protein [Anaerolineales bacterium]